MLSKIASFDFSTIISDIKNFDYSTIVSVSNIRSFDFSFLNLDVFRSYILNGLIFSVEITLIATVLGLIFGTLLAMARLSSFKILSWPATVYITAMRSIPLILVILWFYILLPFITGQAMGITYSSIITFSLFEAAYFAEIMRAGIRSIPQGQKYAGQALGMTYMQGMTIVVLPQAFRNMLPVLLTQVIILFQDTSLVYIISGYDLFKGFVLAGTNYHHTVETYILAAVAYFIICFTLSLGVRHLQKKIAIIR